MRKKSLTCLASLLALALCLGLLPTAAWAVEDHNNHPVCISEENCTNPDHESNHGTVTWTVMDSLPTTAGSYYLTADVTLTSTWTVPPGET